VNQLYSAAREIGAFCEQRSWAYCFIGGLAVLRWGEPRLTRDVDLTLLAGFGTEEPFIVELLESFPSRLDDAAEFARQNRVVLLRANNGTPIDIALGALPFEERAVARSSPFDIGDAEALLTCGAEDLVVYKAFAGRDRDWLDIEGIVVRQAAQLDHDLIWEEVRPLLAIKGTPDAEDRLSALLAPK
jgi:hypothetical protein